MSTWIRSRIKLPQTKSLHLGAERKLGNARDLVERFEKEYEEEVQQVKKANVRED